MKDQRVDQKKLNESKKLALYYMNILVDVARESILILDARFRVLSANPIFYETFHVSAEETVNTLLYQLGNGQWNIPDLKRLLEKVLPEEKNVHNYSVTHTFEKIGEKTILLNAKQIDSVQLIVIAMEDITHRKQIEVKLADHAKNLEIKVIERTNELAEQIEHLESFNEIMVGRELKMVELKKEIQKLKKRIQQDIGQNLNAS
jgi:two-component system, chemotaxis family, CheB/CheR fusion protein